MKLVDILARELKEWPTEDDNGYEVVSVTQDYSGTLNGYEAGDVPSTSDNAGRVWCAGASYLDAGLETDKDVRATIAEDQSTAVVTRAQWEEAVAELGRVLEFLWDGEGRPVAGAKLEWKELTGFQWVAATVLFISDSSVVLQRSDGFEWQMLASSVVFRPIAAPEQIAEDKKRNAAIEEMVSLVPTLDKGWARKVCIAIYDAGYRKPD